MKTVILCGGFGTRIRDVAEDIPKPMIPLGGLPIMWHIMKYYAHWGHKEFVLCLGYKGALIKDFFLNYEAHTRDFTLRLGDRQSIVYHDEHFQEDWEVTLADTGLNSMTGARVQRIKKYLGRDENFMLTYGDGLGNIDLNRLLEFHNSHGRIMTVTGVRPPGRFGEMESDVTGLVQQFNEKPQSSRGLISGGFFVCRKELFDYLDDRENLTFEQEPMRNLVKDQQMMVYQHDEFWQPMDTYRDYMLLKGLYEEGKAPWVVW
jgi:glucose-1-phosphate cytidylyltransferase